MKRSRLTLLEIPVKVTTLFDLSPGMGAVLYERELLHGCYFLLR